MPNSAMLVTRYLPERLKRNLAVGLDARWIELKRDLSTGYNPGAPDSRMTDLISDARQAYALGLINYLPTFAKEEPLIGACSCGNGPLTPQHYQETHMEDKDATGQQPDGVHRSASAHDAAPNRGGRRR